MNPAPPVTRERMGYGEANRSERWISLIRVELRQTVPSSEDPEVREHTEGYLAQRGQVTLPQFQQEFDAHRRRFQKFVPLEHGTRVLEVGVGTGWFLILCARLGAQVSGVELNPIIAEHAREFGREQGHELDITVGNISDVELPKDAFDIVVGMSVFEHVQAYGAAMANIHRALRPGGLFYMSSTNKFAPRSGEFHFPLYGWMPFELRRRLRVARQGPSVIRSSGIDFNQFTY